MGRRIRWLGLVIVVCFALVLLQLVNIQVRQGNALADNPNNPRNQGSNLNNPRGRILAADGTVLAYSVPATSGSYKWQRVYPPQTASLYSGIVGYYSYYYGTSGIEDEYNSVLRAHREGPQSFSQFLSGQTNVSTNDVTLTVQPSIQQAAMNALLANPNANKDGAVVALDPRTGAVLAMASNPTFDPNPLASPNINGVEVAAGQSDFHTKDAEGIYPGYPFATFVPVFPGSTFKVVTSTAVYNLDPSLSNFTWPASGGPAACTAPGEIPNTPLQICNDANTPGAGTPCGGTMTQMLPQSCDPGYAVLGLNVGAKNLNQQATLFGYNSKPPIDLNSDIVAPSPFPTEAYLAANPPFLAYSAFGQDDVQATALQNAMVAAGIADNGTVMTPHLMAEIRGSQGNLVQTYQPKAYKQAATASAAQQVNQLMQGVVTGGTASGIFDPADDVAAKTGTAQTPLPGGGSGTDDWMIAFAPANNPVVAVAVVVPYQPASTSGAEVAGPIMNAVIQAALAVEHPSTSGTAPTTTTTTAPSNNPAQQPSNTTTSTTTSPPTTTPPSAPTTTTPAFSPTTTTEPTPSTTLPTTPQGKP